MQVADFEGMDERNAIKHLMARHAEEMLMDLEFVLPGYQEAQMRGTRSAWNAWHAREHSHERTDDEHTHEQAVDR